MHAEIRQNAFARYELWIDGVGVANSNNPSRLVQYLKETGFKGKVAWLV